MPPVKLESHTEENKDQWRIVNGQTNKTTLRIDKEVLPDEGTLRDRPTEGRERRVNGYKCHVRQDVRCRTVNCLIPG